MTVLRLASQVVRLENVTKRFGRAKAVDDVTFTASPGKLTTLLGPSGCGKTTTLRILGGFYEPDGGSIFIGDRMINYVPPYARSTRTVFQSYALFPHMTVFENVAFGLRATGVRRADIPPRVNDALALVGLTGFGPRQSGQLSGGQQQRVAFARALVTEPEVLLLDEPLSNLDAKLRLHMRGEIRNLQQNLGITTIYVTHDQEEALSLSDHVVIMNDGRIEQQGIPHDIYEKPATRFVADFIGTSNFVRATVKGMAGAEVTVEALGRTFVVGMGERREGVAPGQAVTLVMRPEHLHLEGGGHASEGRTALPGHIVSVSYVGAGAQYLVRMVTGEEVSVHQPAPVGASLTPPGTEVTLYLDHERVYIISDAGDGSPGAA
jgi:iron(III) transport system ATP-binding protein